MKSVYGRLISLGSIVALAGYILSGPAAYIIVNMISPQPSWISSQVFAENYASIQDLPFYFGFLLVGGMLMIVAGHYLDCTDDKPRRRFSLLLSFGTTVVFAALISFNYICQTTFVHNMALHYKPEYDTAISMFSMSNPLSFCWANEMWGYGFLGIATWLMAGYYRNKNRWIMALLITNGIVSLVSAFWTIIDVAWVMTTIGLVAYFIWNALMIVMILLIYRYSRQVQIKYAAEINH